MPFQAINCNEALDAKLTVEGVRPDFVLLQVLRPGETLRTDLANVVPVCLQMFLVVLTRMLLQLIPDSTSTNSFHLIFCWLNLLTKL